jgi:uncharacterized protein YndB with AHSA1/START domain
MDVYERTETVAAEPDVVFDYLKEPSNLPRYLPPIEHAEVGSADHVELDGTAPGGEHFHNEGEFHVDADRRRMEWSADVGHTYSGWLEVSPDGGPDSSRVTVHLEFGPRSVQPEIQAQSSEDRDPTEEALGKTLEAIKRQVEGTGGDVSTDELAPPDA